MNGVYRTRVGYAGGQQPDPTYRNIGDHTETLQVDYDPKVIGFDKLVEQFLATGNLCSVPWSTQYKSIAFYHDDEQKAILERMFAQHEKKHGKIHAQIRPAGRFYVAEDYHQKYYLQQDVGLARELQQIYPNPQDFMNSTAAARLNGWVGGYVQKETAAQDLARLGLSQNVTKRLNSLTQSPRR